MYIKGQPSTMEIVIREIDGTRLEAPITVLFSKEGVARVKEGVGQLLCDMFHGLEIYKVKSDDTE